MSSVIQAAPNTPQSVTNIQPKSEVLIVGSEQEYPPFATGMTDETAGGFTVELWKAVAAEAGLDYTLRVQPFHQVLNNFKAGTIDLLINLAISDERDQFADFTVPHVIVHGAIFVRKGETSIRSEDDFTEKSIIVLKADLAHDYAIARGWEKQLVTVDTNAEGMQLLASGKHDAMLLGKLTGMQTLQKTGLSNIVALPVKAGFSQKFAFAVPDGESRLLAIINEGLALTKANGTYDKLYEQWFGIYEPKEVGWRDVWHYIVPVVVLLFLSAGYFFYRLKIERESSARRYRDLYDNAPTMFLSVEPEKGVVIDCNQTLMDVTGYSREEIVGHPVLGLYHPNCADMAKASFQSFLTNKEVHNVELQLRCRDDRRVDVTLNASAVCDKKGTILYSRSTLHDITEQKQAEESLVKSESTHRAMIDNIADVIAIIDQDGINRYKSLNIEKWFGWQPEDVVGASTFDNVHPEDLLTIQAFFSGLLKKPDTSDSIECRYRCKDNSYKWIEVTAVNLLSNPDIKGVLLNYHDITERKQAEEALCEREEMMRNSQSVAHICAYSSKLNGDEIEKSQWVCSPEFYKIFGISKTYPHTIAGWANFIHPDFRDEVVAYHESVVKEKTSFDKKYKIIRIDDGQERWVHGTGELEFDEKGIPVRMHGAIQDITERKQAEAEQEKLQAQLNQAQKMEAIGTMAGGIAHDFNNLLAIITGNLDIVQYKQNSGTSAEENLAHIKNATHRATNLVAQILAFSRQEKPDLVSTDLIKAVTESLNLLRSTTPVTIEIMTRFADEPIAVNADTTQLQQVILNLASNAAHAMNDKGLLTVAVGKVELASADMPNAGNLKPGPFAKISVSDTGTGMDKPTIERIFDPFFTTKEVGVGTGMGLSVIHGIVERHGGFITVDSTVGAGSTFNIFLPVINEGVGIHPADREPSLPTGTERILFVDDEESIAYTCNELLEYQGYKVTSVTSGIEALDLFKANPDAFDLVFTDQTMPVMTGAELATELLKIRPDIPIVLCSGYSARVSEEDAKGIGIREFCMKPMDMKQLVIVARKVLDEEAS